MANTIQQAEVKIKDNTGQNIYINAQLNKKGKKQILGIEIEFEPPLKHNEPGGLGQFLAQILIEGTVTLKNNTKNNAGK